MRKIISIRLVSVVDTDPDFSWIGEYTSSPGPDDRTIDRQERGDCGRGEYRYFVAAMSGKETGNPESVEQDYARMEDYNRQGWCFVGIQAIAEVQMTKNGPIQKVRSGGLWGIESDSGDAHFQEVGKDEMHDLTSELKAMGFTDKQIKAAMPESLEVESV